MKYCKTVNPQRVSYPDKVDASVQFTNIQQMLMAPFVGYSDIECTLKSEDHVDDVSTGIDQSEKKSTEVKYQAHTRASYFTKFESIVPDFSIPKQEGFDSPQQETYVGEDAAEHYVQQVSNTNYKKYIKIRKKMKFTKTDRKKFEAASACNICEQEFVRPVLHCHNEYENDASCSLCINNVKVDVIVPDHCHITGVSCNIFFSLFCFSILLCFAECGSHAVSVRVCDDLILIIVC